MRYAALLSAAGASEMAAGASEMLAVEDKLLEVIEQLEDPLIASSPTLKAELMKQAQPPQWPSLGLSLGCAVVLSGPAFFCLDLLRQRLG